MSSMVTGGGADDVDCAEDSLLHQQDHHEQEETHHPQSADAIPLDLPSMKKELLEKCAECQQRGLAHTYKWLAEISHALRNVKLSQTDTSLLLASLPDLDDEADVYLMAKSYFDLKEYDRCAYFTQNCKTPRVRFLHYYACYLSGEKKRLDDATDTVTAIESQQMTYLKDLRRELEKEHQKGTLDGYLLYLYGVVLKRLSLPARARDILVESVRAEPSHWAAWLELSGHISDQAELQQLELPDHWIKNFFLAHTYLELHLNEQALEILFGLQVGGLQESTYIMAQVAIAFHNMREVDQAVQYFKQLSEIDPLRLENLDTYSNLLYVKENRVELAHLAHKTSQIDKYKTETCCVIGNYYSLRSQHEKAVTYFQRAIKLNPHYLSAWTLMGHEFIELKNTNAAIQCYRHALEVNKRDYRAWYGLGQTYEVLKMPFYCLYYYKKAQELRPNDSRMLVALGESYEKLDKLPEAMKCFWKAYCVGDIEGGIALFKLAILYERTNDPDQAAAAYSQYILDSEAQPALPERDQQSRAYRYLAQYYIKKGYYEQAYEYAQKCTEFTDTREEAKSMLKEISNRRGNQPKSSLAAAAAYVLGDDADATNNGTDDESAAGGERTAAGAPPAPMPRGGANGTNRRADLEPVNLTFTP